MNRAQKVKVSEDAMKKIESIRKDWNKVLFGVLVAASILWTGSQVYAVGPYFENESSPRGQNQGPNPSWPRPDEPLWSPPNPQILSIESLKKGQIILRSPKKPSTAATEAPDVIDKTHKQVAQR